MRMDRHGHGSHYSSRPASDRYDPRYHYPPGPSITGRTSRSPLRKRRSWPPQPCAEDEIVSLCKEAGSQKLLKDIGKSERVPSRGTVDQEPVIIDVPEYHDHNHSHLRPTGTGTGADTASGHNSTGIPTPPTSEDERARRARRKPSRLHISKDDQPAPELSKRTPSPYAYTKPTTLKKDESSSDRLTPQSATGYGPSRTRLGSDAKPPSHRRHSERHSPGSRVVKDYPAAANAPDGSAIDDDDYDRRYNDKKSLSGNGKRMAEPNVPKSPSSPVVDFATLPAANAPPIRRANLDARRMTDTQNTLPTLGRLNIDKSRKPTPLMASTSLSDAHEMPVQASATLDPRSAEAFYPRSRERSYSSSRPHSRPVSREGSVANETPPSRSPKMSAELPPSTSIEGSKTPSANTSRPASPSPLTPAGDSPRLPRTDLDWSTLLANNAARRNMPPSRLGSAVSQEPTPTSVSSSRRTTPRETAPNITPSQSSNTLPYPEDSSLMGSSIAMPDDRQHAFYPPKNPMLAPLSTNERNATARDSSPAPSISSQSSAKLPIRPTLNRGYSAADASPAVAADTRPRLAANNRTPSFANTSQTKKELAVLVKKGLPPCPRQEPVAGKHDWYTIIGHTNIDFCPDCIDTLFERTVFRSSFRRSLPRNDSDKVRCAFGSPWIRLAWLLTLQQQRTDLTLLQDVADIEESSTPCPGGTESVQNWYGLRDPDGLFVRDFHLCYGDVRKIECLLPTLSGVFVRLPARASYTKSVCAIRMDSTRFSTYLDALVSSHEKALQARKNADPMPLIELVERRTRLRECTKDNVLVNALWHYIPDLAPAMTVCEDCFEAVVEPEIKKNKSLAKKFQRTLQPVYNEGMGCSCQLYSPYMRKVFQRAVEDNDMKYLVRKAKERRDAELRLQDRFKAVMTKARRLSQEGNIDEEDERRLNRELEKISSEWKERWE
ncbi:hypothetical protein AC578_3070 [Pseudocercospora eumusae]|uniref:Uncharacterized protein n=1 Tax=Pseudocercospora eumusae TaxID=321146 RepID=A0A139H466_9PEZI|nr:hypothetical protein AC578_3070 [Pseudocercospora eumusae]